MLSALMSKMKLSVIYGDTDSFFVKKLPGSPEVEDALKIVHRLLDFTPMNTVGLEYENTYKRLILIEPKLEPLTWQR